MEYFRGSSEYNRNMGTRNAARGGKAQPDTKIISSERILFDGADDFDQRKDNDKIASSLPEKVADVERPSIKVVMDLRVTNVHAAATSWPSNESESRLHFTELHLTFLRQQHE